MKLTGKVLSVSVNQDIEIESVDLTSTAISYKAENPRFSFTLLPDFANVPIEFNDFPINNEMVARVNAAFNSKESVEIELKIK